MIRPLYCSWSGGKDCALALDEAVRAGGEARALITVMTESGRRSRSHGIADDVLAAQSSASGIPIFFESASWETYESAFRALVARARTAGATTGVFGDIHMSGSRQWVEAICAECGSVPLLPLWGLSSQEVMARLLSRGFKALIIAVKDGALPAGLLGEIVDARMIDRLARYGTDLAGEEGEYHTLVIDGPIFDGPISVSPGEVVLRDGVWFLDIELLGD